ncbi:thiol peroxidase [Desulfocurvibacter africanus]|uniref:Redoxin domain protein n=1 Tax=Desulfocurvibacter africanus subsp. africanus str. Walvis Bay TaxID=690850 RepID=F3Z1W9_DESAF|nr:thiol peroxidase [Desulfocurvibacter africanus]EGJ50077.1 Redoxin domain protein [Desulfocurvibacter africanus subsp. africanus str. Walvis Bay]
MAQERTGVVTMKGQGLTLTGQELRKGDQLPDVELLDTDLNTVRLADFAGKVLILVAVPSLDTAVCNIEARRFNNEADKLGNDVQVLIVSMDLPFAQKRWAEEAGVRAIKTLSDHRDAAFGREFGILLKELRLLARSVFVADRSGKLQYVQIVPEVTDEPDYDTALNLARELVQEMAA